ncbi:hypothetical protein HDU97_005139 [Phlyctochytrium planicorne]|nr:hypothetical protein HDU97_005139 [Phlyctochytrium planicorne]
MGDSQECKVVKEVFKDLRCCDGQVMKCDGSRVTGLVLSSVLLPDPLPSFKRLASLQNLTTLDMSGSKLSGVLPADIEFLPVLENLKLSDNSFTGVIPNFISAALKTDMGNAGNFNEVNILGVLGDNKPNLSRVNLENLHLIGTLPESLARANLELKLRGNKLRGAISNSFSNQNLDISDNCFVANDFPISFNNRDDSSIIASQNPAKCGLLSPPPSPAPPITPSLPTASPVSAPSINPSITTSVDVPITRGTDPDAPVVVTTVLITRNGTINFATPSASPGSASSSDNNKSNNDNGMSQALKISIGVSCAVLVLFLAFGAYFMLVHLPRKRKREQAAEEAQRNEQQRWDMENLERGRIEREMPAQQPVQPTIMMAPALAPTPVPPVRHIEISREELEMAERKVLEAYEEKREMQQRMQQEGHGDVLPSFEESVGPGGSTYRPPTLEKGVEGTSFMSATEEKEVLRIKFNRQQ